MNANSIDSIPLRIFEYYHVVAHNLGNKVQEIFRYKNRIINHLNDEGYTYIHDYDILNAYGKLIISSDNPELIMFVKLAYS